MGYHRILTVQDISCVGQCSMTVALPILSACGLETCVLPSAVLSTHTGGFTDVVFRDLSDSIPAFWQHWKRENIDFDAVYTGYLGSIRQIQMVKELFENVKAPVGKLIVDPAMADHGKLYKGFDEAYVREMTSLCACADIVLPNITEACMMTGCEFRESYDRAYIENLLDKLAALGAKCVVLTGVSFAPGKTGVMIRENGETVYYCHPKTPKNYHGTGDIFASVFVGAFMQGRTPAEAAVLAADFTALCIRKTDDCPAHWYGVRFETALPELMRMLDLQKK